MMAYLGCRANPTHKGNLNEVYVQAQSKQAVLLTVNNLGASLLGRA